MKFSPLAQNMNKHFIFIAVIVIILIGGILFYFKPQNFFTFEQQNQETDEIGGEWQVFEDPGHLFRFEYPQEWQAENRPGIAMSFVLRDENNNEAVTIDDVNLALVGISFCEMYSSDPKCEVLKTKAGLSTTITWGDENASAIFKSENSISGIGFTLLKMDPDTKVIFRKILESFEFLK